MKPLQTRIRESHRQSGVALVLSLVAVIVVMLLMVGFTQLASNVVLSQSNAVQRKRAFYIAEAGLTEAYAGLQMGKSGAIGSEAEPAAFGDGLLWVEATEEEGYVELESTGMVAGGQVTLSMFAERGETNIASLGLFSAAAIHLSPGARIDSFDSREGPYDPTNPGSAGKLSSNAAITLAGTESEPTVVKGDLVPGPRTEIEPSAHVTVEGSIDPALAVISLPEVAVPSTSFTAGQTHAAPTPLILLPGKRALEFLTLDPDTQAVLQGPQVLTVKRVAVGEGAELVFDTTGGPVQLFVTEHLSFPPSSIVTTTEFAPSKVQIQVPSETAEPIRLEAASTFYGVVYAPRAEISIARDFEVFGAVVAQNLSFTGAPIVHIDESLAQFAGESALPELVSWSIVDLGNEMTQTHTSPFKLLGVTETACPSPAEAHRDQWLELDYLDDQGNAATFEGWESSFDWDGVSKVLAGWRDGEDLIYAGQAVNLNSRGTTSPSRGTVGQVGP